MNSDYINKDYINSESIYLVACSGGADSLCLLHSLHSVFVSQGLEESLICAHFNHRWSVNSIEPAELIKDFCNKSNIKLVYGEALLEGQNSEAEAREERYSFLKETAKNLSDERNKPSIIITAHHLDDQIETFLFRLLRGSGINGLSCIRKEREITSKLKIIRPFLNLQKLQLIEYCRTKQIQYYEDPSNEHLHIKRNFIRKKLIPIINDFQPNYKKQIDNLIDIVQQENEFIDHYVSKLDSANFSNAPAFLSQSIAIQRRILKILLEKFLISINFDLIEKLRKAIINSTKTKLIKISLDERVNQTLFFKCNHDYFEIYEEKHQEKANLLNTKLFQITQFKLENTKHKQIIKIPSFDNLENCNLEIQKLEKLEQFEIIKKKNASTVYVDFSEFHDVCFELRYRRAGDIFQPINCKYSMKLKNFLINRKIQDRQILLMLAIANSNQILWIPSVEISDLIKVLNIATHKIEFKNSFTC